MQRTTLTAIIPVNGAIQLYRVYRIRGLISNATDAGVGTASNCLP